MVELGEFKCACRFYRPAEFEPAVLLEPCGYHAKIAEWTREVRITVRGIDGQARRLTEQDGGEEIIVGYQLNTGLWHRLLGLLSSCPTPECIAKSSEERTQVRISPTENGGTTVASNQTKSRSTLAIALPPLAEGERWAGILLGKDDTPDQHLVLIKSEHAKHTWKKAGEVAHALGGELPTLRELELLRANAREDFEDDWYWSSDQHAGGPDYAWYQSFTSGTQDWGRKSLKLCVVAVRRVPIQPFQLSEAA